MNAGQDHRFGRRFRFHDGASVRLLPGRHDQPTVLYYSRDNVAAGDPLGRAILDALRDLGWRVAEFDSAEQAKNRALDPEGRSADPSHRLLKLRRIWRALARPDLWRYLLHRQILGKDVYTRRSVIGCIRAAAIAPDIVLGYSAGARFGAAIAEDLGLKAVICLGYPFHHPAHGDEPDRYAHLATLRTPCLILQGRNDPYGGAEDLARFQFSPAVAVQVVDADHELRLDNVRQRMAIDAVLEFLRANGINNPSAPGERETQNLPASSSR